MLSLPDKCEVYVTNAESSWQAYSLTLGGAYAPDLFQKPRRFGGIETKRRILGINATAKSIWRVLILPDEY